ncbi:MAG: hypothetical protein NUV65_02570 [Candidatus Roizmanbacteria bacterium]|nr:hypothetical protein [Candidatus Roizmanbacteria bacterium]
MILRNKNKSGLRQSIGSFFYDVSHEVGAQFGEMGKEIVKGVTMLPVDLIKTALFGSVTHEDGNSWAKDWLKGEERVGKPPISAKEGAHSALNIQELFAKNDAKKQAQAKQTLGAALRGQFNATNQPQESAYDRSMKQLSERDQAHAPLELHIPVSGKKQRGSLFATKKRKSSPQDLNRTEYKAGKSQG